MAKPKKKSIKKRVEESKKAKGKADNVANVTKDFNKKREKMLPDIKSIIPLGEKRLAKKLKDGNVIGEVILPTGDAKYYLVDLKSNSFRLKLQDDKEKIFYLKELKTTPEIFLKRVGIYPVVSFDWGTGLPIAVKGEYEPEFDDEYFADIVVRASLVAGTTSIMGILKDVKNLTSSVFFAVILSGLNFLILVLQIFGIV